jgi:sugar lactone lactonase YvrE
MSMSAFPRGWFAAAVFVGVVMAEGPAPAQDVQPVNSGANPYRVIRDWAQLTLEKRPWGGSNGVAIDWPHSVHVDRDGNVWVTDARVASADELKKFPGEDKKGSVVVKFSPEGKVLMTLGTPGVRGNPPDALTDPNAVITDPGNGDIYVSESHTNVEDPNLVGRISVFDRSGKFLRTIGKTGTGPGEFRTPHAMVFDSQGRLIVADRHNHRIQILTKDGKYVGEYREFSRASGLAIDRNDTVYVADSESSPQRHPGWLKGIRVGSLKDGKVTIFVPPHQTAASDGAMGEGIDIDAAGNLYTAEATVRGVTKYVRD